MSLSSQQLAFLSENYRVLNPATGEMNTCFEPLPPVVLIGQYHFTKAGTEVERELLQFFRERTCLLLEGLAPSLKVDKSKFKLYPNIPDMMELTGSDSRGAKNTQVFIDFENLQNELTENFHAHRSALESLVSKIINIINEALEKNQITIMHGALLAEPAVYEIISTLWTSVGEIDRLAKNIAQLQEKIKILEPPPLRKKRYELNESNAVLINEIKKTKGQFQKVIAIWGCGHFNGEAFNRHLGVPGVDFMVLVPSPKLEKECLGEQRYQLGKFTHKVLHVIKDARQDKKIPVKTNEKSMGVQILISSRLYPLLNQTIYHLCDFALTIPKIIILDENNLRSLFEHQDTFTSPPGSTLIFTNFDRNLYTLMNEMVNQKAIRVEAIKRGIQKKLAFCNLTLLTLEMGDSIEWTCTDYVPSLSMASKGTIKLTVTRKIIRIEPTELFQEMKKRSMTEFTWKNDTSLILEGFTSNMFAPLAHDLTKLPHFLNNFAPEGMQVQAVGAFEIFNASCEGIVALEIKSKGDAALQLIPLN